MLKLFLFKFFITKIRYKHFHINSYLSGKTLFSLRKKRSFSVREIIFLLRKNVAFCPSLIKN